MDLTFPIVQDLIWKTELWYAQAAADVRGNIGQFVNLKGEEIEGWGGWTELSYKPASWLLTGVGYTIDNPNNSDIDRTPLVANAATRTQNQSWYVSNTFYPGAGTSLKLNYIHWTTQYRGLADGDDNRFEMIVQYNW